MLTIVGVAIALRLGWAAFVAVEPVSDSQAYYTFATNISQGRGYGWESGQPSTYWAVGPSAYFSFFLLFLTTAGASIVGNLFAAALGVVSVFAVGRKFFGTSAAIWSGSLFAVWPTSIMFTTVYNSEMLFAPLLLASIWAVGPASRGAVAWLIGGSLFALAAYVRPVALLFPVVLGASRALHPWTGWAVPRNILLASLVMALCIAPWTIRNYDATGHLVVISTNAGPNLWMGNNPDTDGNYQPLPKRAKGLSEVERNRMLGDEAKKFILDHPAAFALRTLKKLVLLHRHETIGVAWNKVGMDAGPLHGADTFLKLIGTLYWWTIIVGATGGTFVISRRDGLLRCAFHPVIITALYLITVQSIVVAQDRYHLQWSPLFIVLTGACLSSFFHRSDAENPAKAAKA